MCWEFLFSHIPCEAGSAQIPRFFLVLLLGVEAGGLWRGQGVGFTANLWGGLSLDRRGSLCEFQGWREGGSWGKSFPHRPRLLCLLH